MTRYGYLDMPDDYSDISSYKVQAKCVNCHRVITTTREDAWEDDNGELVTDCMCSERSSNHDL